MSGIAVGRFACQTPHTSDSALDKLYALHAPQRSGDSIAKVWTGHAFNMYPQYQRGRTFMGTPTLSF